jgi:serine/threonine-protein kinase
MTSVFISYQRKPSAMLATLIARELGQRGIEVYLDTQRMDTAGAFPERLKDGIRSSDVFVCLVGDTTFESEWVREEVNTAVEASKPMIPVFQESWQQGQPAPTPAIKMLVDYDGILIFDVKNVYVEQSIDTLARMIENTAAQVRAVSQASTSTAGMINLSVDALAGQTLGQYQLRALLGMGGMGAVYRAHQPSLNRDVALKVLSVSLARDGDYARRFVREAQTAAALEHAHIVPVYDYGTDRGLSYVVMRLLNGGSLGDKMEHQKATGGPLPSLAEVADVIGKLASALDYAHSRGVIHRDIKANNVMFDEQGTPFLVDFGIAKLTGATTSLTRTGAVMGTPSYMAPEQWRGEGITPETDQYALGVLAYGLLTGHMPFEASTPFALMHQHLNESPPPPETWRADVPAGIQAVLNRAMAKESADRYPRVRDFAQAFIETASVGGTEFTGFFTASLPQRPVQMFVPTDTSPRTPPSVTRSSPTVSPLPAAGGIQPARSNRLIWIGALVIVGFILLGIFGTQPGGFLAAVPTATASATATLTPTATPAVPIAQAQRSLTVRAGPGSQYEPVATLGQGAEVTITGMNEDGSWYQVMLDGGLTGWLAASSAAVRTSGDINSVPVAAAPTMQPTATLTPTASNTPTITDTPAPTATETPFPTDTPTRIPTLAATATNTPVPPTPVPVNAMLLYDDVSFTLHNRSGRTLSLEGVIFRSSSGNWNARSWGVSIYTSVPDNNCLRLRNAASGQRQPPAECGGLYGLQLVGRPALFWVNVDQFQVVRDGEVIATCRTDEGRCGVFIP